MIKQIFNNRQTRPGEELVIYPFEKLTGLSVVFDNIEHAKVFVSQFPKSFRFRVGNISGFTDDVGNYISFPHVSFDKMGKNKVTGDTNETGNKKLKRLYDAVKKELEKQLSE